MFPSYWITRIDILFLVLITSTTFSSVQTGQDLSFAILNEMLTSIGIIFLLFILGRFPFCRLTFVGSIPWQGMTNVLYRGYNVTYDGNSKRYKVRVFQTSNTSIFCLVFFKGVIHDDIICFLRYWSLASGFIKISWGCGSCRSARLIVHKWWSIFWSWKGVYILC
jgi:hypothetical protein